MIDLTNALEELNSYKGSEKKKTLIYDNKKYLVKFPDPIREKNKDISYINNAFSEYIGSKIFELCNIPVQETILGKYTYNDKEKIVCGCLDFTSDDIKLFEFEGLALSAYPDKKIDTELNDVILVISKIRDMTGINIELTDNIEEKFYDMFVIDSLIGNTDRHNGNWGIVRNNKTHTAYFAPVFDNGSCLNPMLCDEDIIILDDSEMKNLAINVYSVFKVDGKKINYMSYIKDMTNEELNKAINRVFKNIDIDKINSFIDQVEELSSVRKDFYKKLINIRYEIIKEVYNKI